MTHLHKHSGCLHQEPSAREQAHARLARRAAAAGIVLLKNTGILPLDPAAPIALLGAGAGRTVKGGIGSGDVNNRANVTIYQGLREAGAKITSEGWLADYETRYQAARLAWKDKILADAKQVENPFDAYAANPFVLPQGRPVAAQDLKKAAAALYVISRISGEGKDRRLEKGDYYLSDAERADLLTLDRLGLPIVLLLNAGGPVELTGLLEETSHIEAILQLSQREQYLGKPASTVFSTPTLNRIVSAAENTDEIIEYKNTHLSVKTRSLTMHGAPVGRVVSLLNAAQIQTTEDQLRKKLHYKGHQAKYSFDHLITRSPRMLECIQEAKAYALTDSNIVVVGETGTGKELISQSIHAFSHRAENNFVALNCAALPENLLESELFGYVEGAFTGAAKGGKPGLFEIAHNGTIFLDEISEIPLGLQGRLLRVLQEREIMRLGDNRIIPINIRVIAATNKNLEDLVHAGKFRSDLYYRLYVLQLNLPALRERREDIPLLVQGFIRQFQAREGLTTPLELSEADFRLLQDRPWRGNIRELRNFCERLVVLYQPGTSVSDLLAHLLDTSCSPDPEPQVAIPLPGSSHARIDLPYETLRAVLQECRGNRTQAAAKLGISRGTLWRMLKKYQSQD